MERWNLRKLGLWMLLVLGLTFSAASLTACNTTEGVGEDMEEVGEEIQDAAD